MKANLKDIQELKKKYPDKVDYIEDMLTKFGKEFEDSKEEKEVAYLDSINEKILFLLRRLRMRTNKQLRELKEKFPIKCIICGEKIENPKIGILICENPNCKNEYGKLHKNFYYTLYQLKPSAKEYRKQYMKEYNNKPEVKEKRKLYYLKKRGNIND